MQNIRNAFIVSSLLFGAACTPMAEVTSQPVDVTFTSTANQPALTGYDATFVRSYVSSANASKTETSGATCTFKGSGFNGSVTTPGIVNLPVFGSGSRPVAFTCSNGETAKVSQTLPYNVTSDERISSGASGGLLGVLVMAGVDAASDKSNDTWGYHDVAVTFDK